MTILNGPGDAVKRRIAACQMLSHPGQDNASKIIDWIGKAAKERIHAVCFPEAALPGYAKNADYLHDMPPEGLWKQEKRIVQAAKRNKIAVIVGSAHREDGQVKNSILVIDRDGAVRGRYSKTHLAESWATPGRILPIYRVAGMKSCFMVCHDSRYPEIVRLPAVRGAQICWHCTNGSGLTFEYKFSMSRAIPIARAAENDIFFVTTNSPADPKDVLGKHQSTGNSMIVHPDGNVLAEARHFEERLIIADIDTRDAKRQWALRARNDETILRDWMREGAKLVDDQS
jgi:predicted amidohydrolase